MTKEVLAVYPSQYETEVLLKDGSRIMLRPIRREDTERWLAFESRLSPYAKYLRFCSFNMANITNIPDSPFSIAGCEKASILR